MFKHVPVSSTPQAAENDYDASVLSDIPSPYMMRGNYSMPNDSTDLLIRAETQQWEASSPAIF